MTEERGLAMKEHDYGEKIPLSSPFFKGGKLGGEQ